MATLVNDSNDVTTDEDIVIAEPTAEPTEAVDYLKPISDSMKNLGMEMPDMVATGDLSVQNNSVDKKVEVEQKEVNKKDIPLPAMGSKFMLNGHEYKVVYINAGQYRFSCEPCKGVY